MCLVQFECDALMPRKDETRRVQALNTEIIAKITNARIPSWQRRSDFFCSSAICAH